MSPMTRSKTKDKKASKEPQKASKSSGSGNAGSIAAASAYNPLLGIFHNLETLSASSASGIQTNGRFQNIDEPDENPGGPLVSGAEYDSVSNNGSWSGESEDHKEKTLNVPARAEAVPGSDSDKREKIRQKNEKKHQRQKERRAQELHDRCTGYLMSRKLEVLAQQIVQMGFPHERATVSLILNEGRVAEAVAWLLEGGEDGETYKDRNVDGGNLKIDVSDELAQIADMESRYHCSRQEVERVVVACEGDLEKTSVSLREMNHDPPNAEESGDPRTVSNGKLCVSSKTSGPELKLSISPNQSETDEKVFNYAKGAVVLASSMESGDKNGQPTKRIQSKMEWPKPQQATMQAEKKWTGTGANPSAAYTPLQVSTTAKTGSRYAAPADYYKNVQPGSVREPVIMMQRHQSINAKQTPSTSMSSSPPATAASGYPVNGVDPMKGSSFLSQITSSRSLSPNYLSSNQMYQQFQYLPQKQFLPGTSLGDPRVSSRGNVFWGRTGATPTIYAASSLGLFSGLGSTGTSGASSPVDWNTAGSMSQLDYANIDWSLDRNMSLPRSNGLWLGHSPFTKNNVHINDSNTVGVGGQPSMRLVSSKGGIVPVLGLHDVVLTSGETSAASSRVWSSPFEGKDLFSLPRQFVSSPSL